MIPILAKFVAVVQSVQNLPQSQVEKALLINLDNWLKNEPVETNVQVLGLFKSEFPGMQQHEVIISAILYVQGNIALKEIFGDSQEAAQIN